MRVLLVEDPPRLNGALATGLRQEGFAVDVAQDGQAGLHLATTAPYDLIVLGLRLPVLDGLTVLRRLRAGACYAQVLILTARQDPADVVAGRTYPAPTGTEAADMRSSLVAEALGTFALVFAGCGALTVDAVSGGVVGHVGIAMSFGLVVMAVVYAFGDASGAHVNPAVTIAFWAAGRFPAARVVPYVLTQAAGACAAALALRLLFPDATTLGETLPRGSQAQTFVLEVVITWFLMLVILRVSTGAKETGVMAGAAIGAVVGLAALFAGPICGASMNPARSLAPALFSHGWEPLWIYVLAPVLGALVAVPCQRLLAPRPASGHQA